MRRLVCALGSLLVCQLGGCSPPGSIGPVLFGDDDDAGPPGVPMCDDEACGAVAGTCRDADGGRVCLLLDEPCETDQSSVCKANGVHGCVQGFAVAAIDKVCQSFEQCYQASASESTRNFSFAYCAADPAPCGTKAVSECRGELAVQCGLGFPSYEMRCGDVKLRCSESTDASGYGYGVCANDVICPATVSPQIQPVGNPLPLACDRDAVVDCDSSMRNPSMLLDCTLYGETCSSDGITTCTVSASGPAAPEWLAVRAGHFTPVLGLIAGMPTDVAAFDMLRTEVTLGQYDECVRAGACSGSFGCEPQSDRGDVPLDCATESTAEQYCAWLGGRLPTAAEWEYAARNAGEDVTFPWGDDPITCSDVGSPSFGDGSKDCIGAATVGCRHARDVTAQGICDLVGNLAEWVARVDSNGASERGSSFGSWSPATLGGGDSLNTAGGEDTLGFRCVR